MVAECVCVCSEYQFLKVLENVIDRKLGVNIADRLQGKATLT